MPSENVNKKLLNLDIIRAVAAIMIVLVHLELFGWGGHGVELFLLLTGYTAFLSIDRHKDSSPLSYYRRRLARILPSYYGVVLIYFFIYLVVLGERYPAKQVVVSLIKYFTLTTTFFPRDLIFWFYLGTTGTIVTIMLFYIIAPFLYKLINNFRRSVIALFVAFVICQVWVHFLGQLYAGTEYAGRHPAYFIYLCFFGVAAYFAVKIAKGEKYYKAGDSGQKKDKDEKSSDYIATKKIDNGKSLVPYYSLKPVMVTKNNLDSVIIDSGFHTKEEVYLNVTKKKS